MKPGPWLTLALLLQAQVQVVTTLSPEAVAPGEMFELRIRVVTEGQAPDIVLGPLPAGLELVQTTEQTETRSAFPSGSLRTTTKSYGLVSRVSGTFLLPKATVRVSGRDYESDARVITVRPAGPGIGSEPAAPPRLAVSAEPTRAYVGQAVLLRAEAMFPREIRSRLTRPATYEPPGAPGFWVVDLPNPMTLDLRRIGSEIFEVQTYRRIYVPIIPGLHLLAPARLTYEIRSGLLRPPVSRLVESDSVRLEVLPLPAEGRPAAFAGAVGTFTIRAHIAPDPGTLAVGEAASISVEIAGQGDLRAIPAPVLPGVPGLEILPPAEETDEQLTPDGIGGRKTFTWAVIADKPGRIALAPVAFAYFDPDAREYRVIRSDSIVLGVAGFGGSEEAQGLRPVDPRPSPPGLGFVRSRLFVAVQAVPALLLLLAGVRRRRSADRTDHPPVPAEERRAAMARLRAAAARNETDVANDLAAILRPLLERTGADRDPAAPATNPERDGEVAALLAEVDRARFAGTADADLQSLVARAERLLEPASDRRPGRGLPLLLFLPAALAAGGPARAAAQAPSAFARGVEALAAQDAQAARKAFEAHLEDHPADATGWYNLGNAAYRQGDRGAATHAWLQALALDPRRRDARHNVLTVAGSASDRFLPSRLGLRTEPAILILTLAWWGGVLAWLLMPGRVRYGSVGAALLAAAVAGAGWLTGHSDPDLVTVRADGTTIHTEPTLHSDPVRSFVAGEPFEIRARSGSWLRVRSAVGDEGWVEEVRLRSVSPTPSDIVHSK